VAPGDVLLAIDAQPIRVTGDIARILSNLTQRQAVTIELERGGRQFSATVQL
jgi:type II secretory pathway component PulC